MGISTDDLGRITQQTSVLDADGDKLGTINQIYTSDTTGAPAWVTVKTGLFGSQESFVPLADATFSGDDVQVPFTKKDVHDAPRVDADGHLSVEEEDDLHRYYGLQHPGDAAADRDGDVDTHSDSDSGTQHESDGVAAGTAGAAAAVAEPDRDDELAQRDVEGRDEVADSPVADPRHAQEDDDRSVHAEDGPELAAPDQATGVDGSTGDADGTAGNDDDAVKPGERTTQLRRYVVTERVVRTVEELPDEPSR